ncbi:MAG TPA: hypothetical protein VII06_25715 [Chloroflexota bacterium]|jgi:hypothetical protein
MELKDQLAGMTPEEQTAWLKAHMRNWDEFVQGIVQGREQLAAWRAAGNTGYPPTWITLEEFRRQRELSNPPE